MIEKGRGQINWQTLQAAATLAIFFPLASCAGTAAEGETPAPLALTYDLVIEGGRVIDPETKLDGQFNVGIRDGVITEISAASLSGTETIDASGLVVAPGFIDIHSHSPTQLGARFLTLDGVTTQLDLEAGAFPVLEFGHDLQGNSPHHFGSAVGHLGVRIKVMEGVENPQRASREGRYRPGAAFTARASDEQIAEMRALLHEGLDNGGIGIGVLLDYISVAVDRNELKMVFEVAAARDVPISIHVRRGLPGDPAGLIEAIELAEETGAAVLIAHITHSAMQAVPEWLDMIDAANARGARITTETLTYAAGGTSIGAAVFSRDWQSIFNITYEDVQWTATGEWLTEETWNKYREENPSGMVNHHYVNEEWLETALRWPGTMAVSDVTPAYSEEVMSNPNLAGTFSRFLGHYVRDRGLMSLSEGLARTSLLQAQWLQTAAPAFAKKGRLQEGMDADIVIFDADTILHRADYGAPFQAAEGIEYVVVSGQVVVRDETLLDGVRPGKHIFAEGR